MTAPLQYGTPPPSDPTAVMGRRTLAWLADLLLYLAVILAAFASMAEYTEIPLGIAEEDACAILESQNPDAPDACIAVDDTVYLLDTGEAGAQTLISLGWFVLFVVLQGVTGGSPGKLLFGVRVVDQQGNKPGVGKSLARTLMWIVDAAPWMVPLVGPITAFTSTGHRRVGDLAAGTYVVSSSSVGQPPQGGAAPVAGPMGWGAPPPPGPGWAPPTTPPSAPPTTPPTAPPTSAPTSQSGRWVPPTDPGDEHQLDIRDLEVPEPTQRFDEAPPTVHADPDWSRPPTLDPEPTTELPPEPPSEPTWEAPTLPTVEDPSADWQPPTSPSAEPTDALSQPGPPDDDRPAPAPFAAPGAESPTPEPGPAPDEPPAPPPRLELPPPQWDQARNTYLQWDPNRQAWLQWDTVREQWKPIDT